MDTWGLGLGLGLLQGPCLPEHPLTLRIEANSALSAL